MSVRAKGQHDGDEGEKQRNRATTVRQNKQAFKTVFMYVLYNRQMIRVHMATNGYAMQKIKLGYATGPHMPLCL